MNVISFHGRRRERLKKTCVAIGIFDGMHRGHRLLIRKMLARAKRLSVRPVVVTFFPHPAHVLAPGFKMPYLSTLQDRLWALEDWGVKVCVVIRFSHGFSRMEPETFIEDVLVKQLDVKAVFVGQDFRFGKKRRGDITLFERMGPVYGYETHAIPALREGPTIISSTRIRQLIGQGKLDEAQKLLGRPVSVSGVIVKASGRGKTLGFPTANMDYERIPGASLIVPPQGIYVVRACVNKKNYPAVVYIGTRPSFEKGSHKIHVEAHILDFSKNIYGQWIKVEFLKRIRGDKKFSDVQQLMRQIQKDVKQAKQWIGKAGKIL